MLVLLQHAVFCKLLATDAANERRLVFRVAAHVTLQRGRFAECFSTFTARVLFHYTYQLSRRLTALLKRGKNITCNDKSPRCL